MENLTLINPNHDGGILAIFSNIFMYPDHGGGNLSFFLEKLAIFGRIFAFYLFSSNRKSNQIFFKSKAETLTLVNPNPWFSHFSSIFMYPLPQTLILAGQF